MRKVIRQYEEKNKVIEQIQKNLRMVQTKLIKPNLKIKPQVTSSSFQLNLPTLMQEMAIILKSNSNSVDKKRSYNVTIDKQLEQLIKKQKKQIKPWTQTISFEGENQIQKKHNLIINHRTTLKNFMRNTQKQHFSPNKQELSQQNKGIFPSPSRMLLANKILKFKERKKQTFKQLQKVMQSKTKINFQKVDLITNQWECQQAKKHNRNVDKKNDWDENIFEPYIYKKMKKKMIENNRQSLHKSIQFIKKNNFQFNAGQTELKTMNTIVLSPNRYKRGLRKNKSKGRSYSPWNLQAQNAEINQIWNIELEK